MIVLYGLTGLLTGTILNRLADAYPHWGKVGRTPHCLYCDSPRPVVAWSGTAAYLAFQSQCRSCGAPISWRQPLVELGMLVLFCAFWWRDGPGRLLVLHSTYAAILMLLAVIDVEHRRLPSQILYPAGALALVGTVVHPSPGFWRQALVGGLVGGAAMGLAYLGSIGFAAVVVRWRKAAGSPGLLGWGDVRLGVLVGLMVGSRLAGSALLMGWVLAGLAALGYVVVEGALRQRYRPFASLALGPYLALGAMVVMLVGEPVTAWW